jgi:hypothetical protein
MRNVFSDYGSERLAARDNRPMSRIEWAMLFGSVTIGLISLILK